MTLAHGLGLLALGLILSIGVFWLISTAEHKEQKSKGKNPLDDFHNYMDS